MKTNGDFVSRVINASKSITKDDRISRRYILSIGQDKARTYIAQKLQEGSIQREDSMITHLQCVEFEKVEARGCGIIEFKLCNILMRSVEKIPTPLYSRLGAAIYPIMSLDGSQSFRLSDFTETSVNRNRQYAKYDKKFYYKDGYIYIPDWEVYSVDISLVTMDSESLSEMSASGGKSKECVFKTVWDLEFVCPDKLYEPIVSEAIREVVGVNKAIPKDENPNLDNNQKTQVKE